MVGICIVGIIDSAKGGYHVQMGNAINDIRLRPGSTSMIELSISNFDEETVSCEMKAFDMGIDLSGTTFVDSTEHYRGCADWITFIPNSFKLPPDGKQIVKCKIISPVRTSGGYYGLLCCTVSPHSTINVNKGVGLPIGMRIFSALLLSIDSPHNTAKFQIQDIKLSIGENQTADKFRTIKNWLLDVSIHNLGNVHDKVLARATILDINNRVVERSKLTAGEGFVFPGHERTFSAKGKKELINGVYGLHVEVYSSKFKQLGEISTQFAVNNDQIIKEAITPEMENIISAIRPHFTLEPTELNFKIVPGAKNTKAVQITNLTGDTLGIRADLSCWEQNAAGEITLISDSALMKSFDQWINIEPKSFVLQPRQHKTLKIICAMPKGSSGEYYPAVILNSINKQLSQEPEFVLTRTVILSTSLKGTETYGINITNFSTKYSNSSGTEFCVDIKNNGNISCRPEITIMVSDSKGSSISDPINISGDNSFVIANRARTFRYVWPRALEKGKYIATLNCQFADGNNPVREIFPFMVK
jgi:hypothetical protein